MASVRQDPAARFTFVWIVEAAEQARESSGGAGVPRSRPRHERELTVEDLGSAAEARRR